MYVTLSLWAPLKNKRKRKNHVRPSDRKWQSPNCLVDLIQSPCGKPTLNFVEPFGFLLWLILRA